MAPLCFRGLKGNHWLGMSQSRHLRRVTHRWHSVHFRGGSSSNGTAQDYQTLQAGKHTHLLPHFHRNSGHMGWHGYWTSPGLLADAPQSSPRTPEIRSTPVHSPSSSTQWTPNEKPLQPLFNTLLSFHANGFVLVGNNTNKNKRTFVTP